MIASVSMAPENITLLQAFSRQEILKNQLRTMSPGDATR